MEQEKRVARMEVILNEAKARLRVLDEALTQYEAYQKEREQLAAYYQGPDWMNDFDADGRGEFPKELRRGVLSEDAVYDFFEAHDEVMERMQALLEKEKAR